MKKLYLLLLLLLPLFARAQDPDESETLYQNDLEEVVIKAQDDQEVIPVPPAQPTAMRDIRKDQWDDASRGLDYSEDVPKSAQPKKRTGQDSLSTRDSRRRNFNGDWLSGLSGLGNVLQVIAILLAIALVGYGAWRMLQAPRNRTIASDGVVITADNIDQYIHETDLERFLREALAAGNYPLAVRLYYLQIIKDLSAKNAIKWSREKTNRDYQREMRNHHLSQQFRQVTLLFERVWYGNDPLGAADYAKIEPEFKAFLAAIV